MRILLIDNTPNDRLAVARGLREWFPRVVIHPVGQPEEFALALDESECSLVIADDRLGWADWRAITRRVRKHWPQCPVILFGSEPSRATEEEARASGVRNWLAKAPENLPRLAAAVGSALVDLLVQQELSTHEGASTDLFGSGEEGRWRVLVENSLAILQLMDQAGGIEYVSPSVTQMLGYAPEELRGRNAFELVHPEELSQMKGLFAKLLAEPGGTVGAQVRVRCKDGHWMWMEATGTNLLANPGIRAVVVSGRDVTRIKRSESALQQVAEAVGSAIGVTFFQNLVRQLALTLDADYAMISEAVPGTDASMRTVALYGEGRIQENFVYSLTGTPCEEVLKRRFVCHAHGVRERYPEAPCLKDWGIESFVGLPLCDSRDRVVGALAILSHQPHQNIKFIRSILRVFATRVGGEIERKQAEDEIQALNADLELRVQERTVALRDSESLMRCVLDSMKANIAVLDRHGRITAINDAWACFAQENGADASLPGVSLGANYLEVCERTTRDLGEEAQQVLKGLRGVLSHSQKEFTYEYACHLPTELRWFVMHASPLSRTEGGAVIAHINTTERKRAEQVLADFKAALDEHAIVAITDSRGTITYVNDKFCSISKYSRAELIGQDHRIVNSGHHPKAFIRDLWQTITSGRVWKGEIKNRAKDGTFYWVDTTIVPFLGADGRPSQYIAIRADMTERKQAEESVLQLNAELRQRTAQLQEANKELESFSYSVSHYLRAPLRHIHGYVDMLSRAVEGQLSDKAKRYLQTIADASQEMGRLIDDLLAFSRMCRAELHGVSVDLNQLVQECVRNLEMATRNRNIIWNIPLIPPVMGDPAMLRQVFANLLGNAVKYTRPRDPAEIEIGRAGEEEGRIIFFVRDNGVGFDPQYAHKLFGVFQRLHRAEEFEGTGIGLANVQRIIARHGGRTWAEGKLNEGATFYFTLSK